MKTIGILVGEDADLPQEIIKTLPIEVFPFPVTWDRLYDSNASFYQQMRTARNDTPVTSQPSMKTFQELFKKQLAEYQDLIVITISSQLSGTYNTAQQAKKLLSETEQQRVYLIDSRSSTASEALVILQAAHCIAQRKTTKEILSKLEAYKVAIHLIGAFDDPHWLRKGGRINAVQAMVITNMLKAGFRPILTMKEGKIVTKKIQTRAKDKVAALFIQFREEHPDTSRQATIAITHSDCEQDAVRLKDMITKEYPQSIIKYITMISPVIGSHLGPDALLLAWI